MDWTHPSATDRTHQRGTAPTASIAPDCRHYRGDKPCVHNRVCAGCNHYAPFDQRLCIIKLGALGDVIRTLCILPELRCQHPNAQITWVSLPNGCRMITGHPMIDRVLPFAPMTAMALAHETFDTVICLDKEPEPCGLAMSLKATRKLGVGLSAFGTPIPLNPEGDHYFNLGLSDELKFHRNRDSYPKLVYAALGLTYDNQCYELPTNTAAQDAARQRLAAHGWRADRPTLGINVGAGRVFANKMWPAEKTIELVRQLRAQSPDTQIVLLGGPDEKATMERIHAAVGGVIAPGSEFDEPTFVGLVDACDALFCGDTMAMHVAIALGKRVVAFFGPTCEQEIDLFGRGEKLVAEVACGPCYKRKCDKGDACLDAVTVDDALAAISRVLDAGTGRSLRLPVIPQRRAG